MRNALLILPILAAPLFLAPTSHNTTTNSKAIAGICSSSPIHVSKSPPSNTCCLVNGRYGIYTLTPGTVDRYFCKVSTGYGSSGQ